MNTCKWDLVEMRKKTNATDKMSHWVRNISPVPFLISSSKFSSIHFPLFPSSTCLWICFCASTAWDLSSKQGRYYRCLSFQLFLPPSCSLSLGTLLTGWFKGEHYGAGDEIISFLSSTALFPLLMGSPAASEARGERRVLRKKQLASNMRLTLRSCGRGSGCFQHQMISDLGP